MTIDPFPGGRSAPSVPPREPPARRPLAVPLGPTAPRPPGCAGPGAAPRATTAGSPSPRSSPPAGFLVAAAVAVLAGAAGAAVLAPWLPLHLALAGGASTAIAGVMPFFVAALAASPPASARLRGSPSGWSPPARRSSPCGGSRRGWAWAPVVGGAALPRGDRRARARRAGGGPVRADAAAPDRDPRLPARPRERGARGGCWARWPRPAGCRSSSAGRSSGPPTRGPTSWASCRWSSSRPGCTSCRRSWGRESSPAARARSRSSRPASARPLVALGLVLGLAAARGRRRAWWRWSGPWRWPSPRHGSSASAAGGRPTPAGTSSRRAGWSPARRGTWSGSGWRRGWCWRGRARRLVHRARGRAAGRGLGDPGAGGVVDAPAAGDRSRRAGGACAAARPARASVGRRGSWRSTLGVLLLAVGWPTGSAAVAAVGAALAGVVVVGSVALAVAAARLARAG